MKQNPKYVNFIGAMLAQGQYLNMCPDEKDMLTGSGSQISYYIAPVFDSGQEQESWQSLHILLENIGCSVTVLTAASDQDFSEQLTDPERTFEEKEAIFESMDCIRKEDCEDILLYALCGRYFYLMIKIQGQEESEFVLSGAKMEFPKNSFLDYFPEVYRANNDFFERFVTVFQTLYLNLEKEVDRLPDRLDYEKAQGEDLIALANWAGLYPFWIQEALRSGQEQKLRRLIAAANEIQSGKGTCHVLELLMELLYDRKVSVLEYFKWYEYVENDRLQLALYQKLYGSDRQISVFLEEKDKKLPDSEEISRMTKALKLALPIGTDVKLIPLKKCSHTDSHCYLDKNSHLASPAGLKTDEARLYGNLVLR